MARKLAKNEADQELVQTELIEDKYDKPTAAEKRCLQAVRSARVDLNAAKTKEVDARERLKAAMLKSGHTHLIEDGIRADMLPGEPKLATRLLTDDE